MARCGRSESSEVNKMIRKSLARICLAIALAVPSIGMACQFDTDCGVGSKCLKSSGQLYGICAGGMNPGNDDDRQPVYDPLDPNETVGDTCSFNTDCGPGNKCLKSSGQIKGVCVKGR
jgi:hypothetical protein